MAKTKDAYEKERERLYAEAQRCLAKAVRNEGRICFGLAWFADEADANAAAAAVRAAGYTYNGGFYHGMPCGRSPEFDRKDADGRVLQYAVSC